MAKKKLKKRKKRNLMNMPRSKWTKSEILRFKKNLKKLLAEIG